MQRTHRFSTFIWTDIENPQPAELEQVAAEHRLDLFQIQDSLQLGHLPKFEPQPGYSFMILRAFTSNIEEGATTISDLSNKIAFFYNEDRLITIHRSPFAFLADIPKEVSGCEAFILHLADCMARSYQVPLDTLDRQIAAFEETIFLKDYSKVSLEDLYYLKTQTRITRKLLQLFQHAIAHLEVSEANRTAMQDIRDRMVSLILSYEEVMESA
ncbi:MAG: hypothetical protein KJS92_03385, partial [Bacteroidetes bacterium]|nr:hypothetical protein [Bacteroidota bacterium]